MILPIDAGIHQQLVQAVERCGISTGEVQITYADDLQSELIYVRSKELNDDHLRCLHRVQRTAPYPIVLFEEDAISSRDMELQRLAEKAAATTWLRERGMLDTLPSYDPAVESAGQFAEHVELFCGFQAGSILMVHDSGILIINPGWVEESLRRPSSAEDDYKFECLLKTLSASNMEDHGLRFGLIGNEAISSTDPRR